MKLSYPFNGSYPITQLFGVNPQDYPGTNGHMGIDWGMPLGTVIFPAMPGKVISAGWNDQGYGNLVILEHPNKIKTYYAHLEKVSVLMGKEVDKNDAIGYSGNTGNSTGPHLHFEYRVNNKPIDPMKYFSMGEDDEPPVVIVAEWRYGDVAIVAADILNIRAGASAESKDLGDLARGYKVRIVEVRGRWVRIMGEETAWLCGDYLNKKA